MGKQDIWVSGLRDLVHFLYDHHRSEGRRHDLADGETAMGKFTPEYYMDILPAAEAIKLDKMVGDLVDEMRRLRLEMSAPNSSAGKAYAAMAELRNRTIEFKRDHDASIACAERLGQPPTYGRLVLPRLAAEYGSLLLCSTCHGCGAVFVQHPTGLDDPKMEYVREPCPGPNVGRGGVPCPHGAMESERVGEAAFAPDPDIVINDEYIHATLADGRRVSLPLSIASPPLAAASDKQRRNFEVYENGIHWPDIDDDIMAETFGGAPSRVFPDSTLGDLVKSAKTALETADESVRNECGPLLKRVCDCNCHRFFCAIPASVPSGDGRECIGMPSSLTDLSLGNTCVKCGQRRGGT